MFKCEWCKSKIDGSAARSSTSLAHICDKCKKNEVKYGKPNSCKYCHLRAAFVESKCVHCAYSERKLGPPVPCSKCKLSSAFPKDPRFKNNKNLLCRLCKASSAKLKQSPAKKRKPPQSAFVGVVGSKKLRLSSDTNGADVLSSEQVLAMSVLKDQIADLQKQLTDKDRQLIERDKTNASLNAQMMHMTRDHRTKVQSLAAQSKEREDLLNREIRTLNRQVTSLQRLNAKKGIAVSQTDSADDQSPL